MTPTPRRSLTDDKLCAAKGLFLFGPGDLVRVKLNSDSSPKRYWRGPRSQEVWEEGDYT